MSPTELKRVKTVFSEALDLAGPERDAFIEQACGDDVGLRAEVQAYLDAAEEGDGFLDSPSVSVPAVAIAKNRPQELLGSTIGRYKIIELIGEGGFGSVFMAEQQQPVQRQVALKIIKLGMDTQRVIARFEAERQALAIMDHPNIARVFDAGATETGRPYFVMELVRGVPITEHCDSHRLSTVQRLELFVIVCNAIQHAHNKGIIHRDIKPSNVLVTLHDGVAVPKVIDFGIAKATDNRGVETTIFTEARQFVGTPAYMSPEQAGLVGLDGESSGGSNGGLDIDTRADIYSLGVLLYELLTGTTPFDPEQLRSAAYGEVQRVIREVDPPKPSTRLSALGDKAANVAASRNSGPHKLRQLLRGELDWIVMKAIEKDRARRYETANELARDIRRHLNDEPIEARAPSAVYVLRKFVRRNRTAVLTTAAFAILVGVLAAVYIHGMRSEQRKTHAALVESQQATIRALAAEAQANEQLVVAAITQAHGARFSTRSGRRFNSLKLLATAAKISPSSEVRSQAIACMGVADLRITQQWSSRDRAVDFNHACTQFADCTASGEVLIRRVPDAANTEGALIVRLPGHAWKNPLLPGSSGRVVFSRDDQQVAVAFDDGHVRVFGLDGKLVFDIAGGPACDLSPDGSAIAVATPDGSVAVYGLKTNNQRGHFRFPRVDALLFSPDGRKLALWSVGRGPDDVCIVEFGGDTPILTRLPLHAVISGVDWHPSGKVVAIAVENRAVDLWDIGGEAEPRRLHMLFGHAAPVVAVKFSHSGDLLASASEDGTVRLWDSVTYDELVREFCTGTLRFSTEDRVLAVGGNDGAHTLLEVADGRERRSLFAPSSNRERVAFSRDGCLLACEGGRIVRFWNLTATGVNESRADLKFSQLVRSVAFHPAGNCVVVATDGGLSRISIREPRSTVEAGATAIRQIHIGGRSKPLLARLASEDGAAEMSQDGNHVALSQFGKDVMVVDLNGADQPLTIPSSADTSFLSLSPDAKWVATGTLNGTGDHRVKIWDAKTGKLERALPISLDANVAFSPDNRWLVTATADELRFWEVGSWQPRHGRAMTSSLRGHIFFSPDSRILAISSQQLGVRLVDVNTAADLATLEDEGDERPLGFSPDGTLLVTKGRDFTIRLWDLRRVREELAAMGLDWPEPPLPPQRAQPRIDLSTLAISLGE